MGTVFPFYATADPEMFAIERAAMDRQGQVIAVLDGILPKGLVLDIGAGDGFTGAALAAADRTIVGLDPAIEPMRPDRPLHWVVGEAEALPFGDDAFDAAYATWAYFFTTGFDPSPGLDEVERVVRPGGGFAVVDNLGDDEFTVLSPRPISCDPDWWLQRGFALTEVETAFQFESLDDARRLLAFYFGDDAADQARLEIEFRAGVFAKPL